MDGQRVIQGRRIGAAEIATIRELIGDHRDWSRYKLSRALCELWDWRDPTGQLKEITNNTRMILLPWVRVPHLASHVLSQVLRRVRADWHGKYNRRLELVETFVDTSRFGGASYRAANWIDLGLTKGRTRQDRWSRMRVPAKRVLVYPLHRRFRQALCS